MERLFFRLSNTSNDIIPRSNNKELPNLKRHHLVIIDESHNLRNRQSKRYQAVKHYISNNDSKVVLLSATPYNKSYDDLSSQLRLFLNESEDLGIRPEEYIKSLGGTERYHEKHQSPIRTIGAFENSNYTDDWRELMRLFMVRRTRSFIAKNYAKKDKNNRSYLDYSNGDRFYFPLRIPKNIEFEINENDPNDDYAKLYSLEVVDIINKLELARYGLGNFVIENPVPAPSKVEKEILDNLSQAGRRLMGFCRTIYSKDWRVAEKHLFYQLLDIFKGILFLYMRLKII